jgi:hypothetical protein
MPRHDAPLVIQQLPTVLGLLELGLPAGAALTADPGAAQGSAWYWLPQPGLAVLTVTDGDATLLTPGKLLELERSLSDVSVQELRDEPGDSPGERHMEFLSVPEAGRVFVNTPAGHEHPVSNSRAPGQRARFRFWQRGSDVVRVGYRLERSAESVWRPLLDHILDSARLP